MTIALILLILMFHTRETAQMMLQAHRNASVAATLLTTTRYLTQRYSARYRSILIAVIVTKDTEQKKCTRKFWKLKYDSCPVVG